MTKKDAMRAAVEAIDGLLWYVGALETLVYDQDDKGEHDQVIAARSALSLLRAVLEEGEEPTDEMVRAGLAVQWPGLYRDSLFTEHDGPGMRKATEDRIALLRKQWAAMLAASPTADKDAK